MACVVLIIEDEPSLSRVLRRCLVKMGHAVTLACDGVQAMTYLESERFDLVLCDVRMPNKDGPATLREATALLGDDLPTWIFLTGYADASDAELIEAGAARVLGKPIGMRRLREELAQFGCGGDVT